MLALRGIDKWFGATHAVRDVTLEAGPGQTLGLVGENGAGKSTLMKIASGVVKPDKGQIELYGKRLALHNPGDALTHGIQSVFQELALVGSLTVAENLFLLHLPVNRWGVIDRGQLYRRCNELLERYEIPVDSHDRVEDLPLGQRQMLEVVRAVHREPVALLLDEATSALGEREVAWLHNILEGLRKRGTIVIFTSHRWEEITQFCDRVAVLRNGELVHVSEAAALDQDAAVRLMTGRPLQMVFPAKAQPTAETVLRVEHVQSSVLRDVSFELSSGEILGLGGLIGQGQRALLEAVFGVHPFKHGRIVLNGLALTRLSPPQAIRLGVAYVPQDRKTEGLLMQKNVSFNLTLCILRALSGRFSGLIDHRAERRIVADAMARLQIRAGSGGDPITNLSGGNQQKVLLQKWLLIKPRVLLLNDVTRGVDIATKAQIYHLLIELAGAGVGILLYSTDTDELVRLANRVLVFRDGAVNAEFSGQEITADAIVRASISKGHSRATSA